jgi:hypothetical protein
MNGLRDACSGAWPTPVPVTVRDAAWPFRLYTKGFSILNKRQRLLSPVQYLLSEF